jgi:hypothetical protein
MKTGGLLGIGGSLYLGAGQATGVSSIGGSVDLVAGDSASKGGDVHVSSGSGAVTSGKIGIVSNAALAGSTSGDILIGSGLSSGGESGAGKCCILNIISVQPILHADHHATSSFPFSGNINRRYKRVNSRHYLSEGWSVKTRPRWKCRHSWRAEH